MHVLHIKGGIYQLENGICLTKVLNVLRGSTKEILKDGTLAMSGTPERAS